MRYAQWEAERIVAYRQSGAKSALGTHRSLRLRAASARLWPLKPPLRFLQKYLLQGGFLEGWQGMLFALMMAFYDLITLVKVIQIRRRMEGKSL